jgi:UDP-N-acetylglucosamine 1-carboxyvinyltransferase
VTIRAIRRLGVRVTIRGSRATVDPSSMQRAVVLMLLALKIRSSMILIGILLACSGEVDLPFPGGCDFGRRKFDLHITGLRALGARISRRT